MSQFSGNYPSSTIACATKEDLLVVLSKLASLSAVAVGRRISFTLDAADLSSSSRIVSSIVKYAGNVSRILRHKEEALINRQILLRLLFSFLANLPPWFLAAQRELMEVELEPSSAHMTSNRFSFWQIGSLIQDFWEHNLSDEVVVDEVLKSWLSGLEPGSAFDFGCGAGYFAFTLASNGWKVFCKEAVPLKRAFVRFARRNIMISGQVLFSDDVREVDLVLAINVLDHVQYPAEHIRQLAAVLRQSGLLVVAVSFQDDGWHTGTPALATEARGELAQYFALHRRVEVDTDVVIELHLLR